MVREYEKCDIDQIVELFNILNELSDLEEVELRKELEEDKKIFVYDVSGDIKGMSSLMFWKNAEIGSCAEIIMSVKENSLFGEIANSLWEASQPALKEKQVVYLITEYNEKNEQWSTFFSEKKFGQWFGIHGMIFKGKSFEETKLMYRNYEDSDFDMYYNYLGESFCEMRTANDIRPYNVFIGSSPEKIEKLKKETLEQKDSIYLFYDNENFVGSSIIKHEEIDDLFVVPEYLGKGYGRKIMQATMNLALKRDFSRITLGVVAWNKVALALYKSLGFEIYQSFAHKRLFIDK